jgi:hypothetical protein
LKASDDVIVSVVSNAVPVANAGIDKTIFLPTNTVTLQGSATDSDGTISGYLWTKVSGGSASLANTNTSTLNVGGLIAGTYIFQLTVTDNRGAKTSDEVSVFVKSANIIPVAKAGADKKINYPVSTVAFYGSGTDSDGTISAYSWTKLSGGAASLANANTATLNVSDLVPGTYYFRFSVTDSNGARSSDDVKLTVNAPPVAIAGADLSVLLPVSTVTISGNGTDSDGTIIGYLWLKMEGPAVTLADATTPTLKVSGLAAGTYTFRLRVKDNYGATDTDDVKVIVSSTGLNNNSQLKIAATNDPRNIFHTQPSNAESEFFFFDKKYPGGYNYTVVIFNKNGEKTFSGKWSDEVYKEMIGMNDLYIYQIIQNGIKVDAGKFIKTTTD